MNKQVEELVERVAEKEHKQWVAWSKSLIPELNDILHKLPEGSNEADALYKRLLRWQSLQIPYGELTEIQKKQDRVWAYKVLNDPDLALITETLYAGDTPCYSVIPLAEALKEK